MAVNVQTGEILVDQIIENELTTGGVYSHDLNISSQDAFIAVLLDTGPGNTINSVQFNGVNLTTAFAFSTVNGLYNVFVLKNPPVGTHSLSINISGTEGTGYIILSLLGVDKTTNSYVSANVGNQSGIPSLVLPKVAPGSFIVDWFGSADNPGFPNQEQYRFFYDNVSDVAASFKFGSGNVIMGWQNSSTNFDYYAIAFPPAKAYSIWNPINRSRNSMDVLNANGLDSYNYVNIPNPRKFGSFPSTFFQNSFLHTIGRTLAFEGLPLPPPTTATQLGDILVDQIIENELTTGGTYTHDISVTSQDAFIAFFLDTSPNNTITSITFNGVAMTSALSYTTVNGIYQVSVMKNPPVGTYPLQIVISGTQGSSYFILSLLGVDKTVNSYKSANVGSQSGIPSLTLPNVVPGSLLIDFLGSAQDPGFPNADQYRIGYDNVSDTAYSYKFGSGNAVMGWQNSTTDYDYYVVAFPPAKSYSIWNPTVTLRNSLDVLEANGLDSYNYINTPAIRKFGVFSSQFFQNSFIHTIGRFNIGAGINHKTLALATTLQAPIEDSTVAILTILITQFIDSTLALNTGLEATTNKTLALATKLESSVKNKTLALATTLNRQENLALATRLESSKKLSTVALTTSLVKLDSTLALKTTLEIQAIKTLAVLTTLEPALTVTFAIATILEKTAYENVAILTTLEATIAIGYRENLIPNPSFELSSSWTTVGSGASFPNNTEALFGSNSLQIICSGTNNAYAYVDIAVIPGLTYTFSAYGLIENYTSGSINIQIQPSTDLLNTFGGSNFGGETFGGGSLVTLVGGNYSTTGSWNQLPSITYTIPNNVYSLQLILDTNNLIGTAYFDGVLFEARNTLNPYFDGSFPSAQWTGVTNDSPSLLPENALALATQLESANQYLTLAINTTLEESAKESTVALKTTLQSVAQNLTVALKTTLQSANQHSTVAISTSLQEAGVASTSALLTTLEPAGIKSTLALKTTLQSSAQKSTFAINTTLEESAQESTVAIKTLLEATVNSTVALATRLEPAGVKSTVALETTLETIRLSSTCALFTTLEESAQHSTVALATRLEEFPKYSTVALNTRLEPAGVKLTLALNTELEKSKQASTLALLTTLEVIPQESTVAIKTTLEKSAQYSTVALKTLLEATKDTTLALNTILEPFGVKSTLALATSLQTPIIVETLALLATLEASAQYSAVALNTKLETSGVASTVALATRLESTAQYSTLALKTTLEVPAKYSTVALNTKLEATKESTVALITRLEATKENTLALETTLEVIPQYSTVALFTSLSKLKQSTLALNTELETAPKSATLGLTTNLLHFIGWDNDLFGHLGWFGDSYSEPPRPIKGSSTDGQPYPPTGGFVDDGS